MNQFRTMKSFPYPFGPVSNEARSRRDLLPTVRKALCRVERAGRAGILDEETLERSRAIRAEIDRVLEWGLADEREGHDAMWAAFDWLTDVAPPYVCARPFPESTHSFCFLASGADDEVKLVRDLSKAPREDGKLVYVIPGFSARHGLFEWVAKNGEWLEIWRDPY